MDNLNPPFQRTDGRALNQIRPVHFDLNVAPHASGSVLVAMGNTRVICGVMIEEFVPRWMKEMRCHACKRFGVAFEHADSSSTKAI